MNKKIICLCLITLVILSSLTTIIIPNNVNAEEPPEQTFEMLPLDYMWFNITENLSTVIINNEIYPTDGEYVRKGRAFGSDGDHWTAKFLNDTMHFDLNLENVKLLPLGPIKKSSLIQPYRDWYYTSRLDTKDFTLIINSNITSNFPKTIPKNESYAFPSTYVNNIINTAGYHNLTYNRSFDHVRVFERNITNLTNTYGESMDCFGGLYTGEYINVTNCSNIENFYDIVAEAIYIPSREDLPADQEGKLFIVNDTQESETILENISHNASGVLLVYDSSKSQANLSSLCVCAARVNITESYLNDVIELLENDTFIIADNVFDNETITFQYGFENVSNPRWEQDHVLITWLPTHDSSYYFGTFCKSWARDTKLWWLLNKCMHNIYGGWCYGWIVYDVLPDAHFMDARTRFWVGWSNYGDFLNLNFLYKYGFPAFSVNYTVGSWIHNQTQNNVTISGFIDQEYIEEKHIGETWTAGVEAYNVEGNITIPHSPGDAIVCISNRYDGWYSPASGDSGLGAGVVLGIAKYMKDHNMTPKYNLTFLMTTGEEYGFRGAWHYTHSHPDSTIIRWIGVDQLGFKQEDTPLILEALCNQNKSDGRIIWEIVNQSGYTNETGNVFHNVESKPIPLQNYGMGGTDDVAWRKRPNCNTICFLKSGEWLRHHKAGINYTEGDTFQDMDRNDANWSFQVIWDTVKYFCVNPNCWFDDVTYEAINTSGGTAPDTLKTTYTVKSVLPSDLVMIHARFYNTTGAEKAHQFINITANRTGVTHNITFSLPPGINEGDYNVTIEVYNSTARINRQLNLTNNCSNDTGLSQKFHLNRYCTLGDIRIGTETADAHDIIRGSKFTPLENAVVYNITAYVYGTSSPSSPTYQCMIYNASDDHLIGYTDQIVVDETEWITFTFATKPVLYKNTEYLLTIWGDTTTAKVYATPLTDGENAYHANYTFGTPPTSIDWNDAIDAQQYSLFCSYIPVNIINVQASPHTVGYGYNVTISADVSALKGVNQVKVHINPPEGGFGVGNYTMTHMSGDTYQYVFPLTWTLWRYNFTIWMIDNTGFVNSSSDHHFHVSVNATISIATLQDTYTGNEYINITDPPNPVENLTVVGRGLTWDTYYNADTGQNILEVSTMPINYKDDNDTWAPINTTLNQLPNNHPAYAIGYRKGNDHGLYGLYFKTNAQQEWPVAFTYNRSDDPTTYAVRSKLMGVGYVDPANNWSYEYLQSAQSSQGQTTGNSITYEDVFTGTDVTWSYSNTGLKEEIILSNTTKTVLQNHPPSQYGLNNETSYLVFITKLDHQNLNLYNISGELNENVTITESGVDFKDALGRFACALPLGEAYEVNNQSIREKLNYRIIHLNGTTYLFSGLRVSDLSAMTFPVVIDPTIKVYPTTSDGHISNSSTNYNTAWTATTGAISSTSTTLSIGQQPPGIFPTYYVYRGYLFFDTNPLPSNAYIDNATIGLYKSTDYSTTDFLITVQNGQPTYPHDPLQTGDYGKNLYSGNGGVINTSTLINGYNNITLNSDGKNWLNRTGQTKLCLRSNRDINGNTPINNEYVKVYTSEQGTGYEPLLTITYRNQSKIKNTGSTTFKGYLLIQVQFNDSGTWVVDNDLVNETSPRTITILDQLALDQIFNGMLKASELRHGNGTYRVYTAFRNPNGTILRTETMSGGRIGSAELKAWWQFTKT